MWIREIHTTGNVREIKYMPSIKSLLKEDDLKKLESVNYEEVRDKTPGQHLVVKSERGSQS